jgi:hypothetical protein
MELPAMAEGLLEDENEARKWEPPVRNLDKFFTSMYNYYHSRGLPTIILSQVCAITTLGFTTVFSVLLIGNSSRFNEANKMLISPTLCLGFVDWSGLRQCHDESSCGSLGEIRRIINNNS